MDTPPSTTESSQLYHILNVPKNASLADIKKAYKALALKYHPDKNPSPEAATRFKSISHAYDILSDPHKRKVYDTYGDFGLSVLGTPMEVLVDPSYGKKLCEFGMTVLFAMGLLVAWCALIAGKVDNGKYGSWWAVFVPVWVLDGLFFVLGVPRLLRRMVNTQEAEEPRRGDTVSSSSGENTDSENGGVQQGEQRMKRRLRKKRAKASLTLAYFALLVLFQVLIVVKLEGGLRTVKWGLAFIPYWILEALHFGVKNVEYTRLRRKQLRMWRRVVHEQEAARSSASEPLPAPSKPSAVPIYIDTMFSWFLRILFAILLVIKLDTPTSMHWAVVFIPTYLYGFVHLTTILLGCCIHLPRVQHEDTRSHLRVTLTLHTIGFVVVGAFGYAFVGMLVRRLQGTDGWPPLASAVFVPVWIAASIFGCCCGCCVGCMGCLHQSAGWVPEEDGAGGATTLVGESMGSRGWRLDRNMMYVVASPDRRLNGKK